MNFITKVSCMTAIGFYTGTLPLLSIVIIATAVVLYGMVNYLEAFTAGYEKATEELVKVKE